MAAAGGLAVGITLDIERSDGRVHSATCSAVNSDTRVATVEWFEKGETKGKEIDFDVVFALNPDLAPQQETFKKPQAPSKMPRAAPFTALPPPDDDASGT